MAVADGELDAVGQPGNNGWGVSGLLGLLVFIAAISLLFRLDQGGTDPGSLPVPSEPSPMPLLPEPAAG